MVLRTTVELYVIFIKKKDIRINVFHQNNRGVSYARNIGLDNCQGEYVCFIDGELYN